MEESKRQPAPLPGQNRRPKNEPKSMLTVDDLSSPQPRFSPPIKTTQTACPIADQLRSALGSFEHAVPLIETKEKQGHIVGSDPVPTTPTPKLSASSAFSRAYFSGSAVLGQGSMSELFVGGGGVEGGFGEDPSRTPTRHPISNGNELEQTQITVVGQNSGCLSRVGIPFVNGETEQVNHKKRKIEEYLYSQAQQCAGAAQLIRSDISEKDVKPTHPSPTLLPQQVFARRNANHSALPLKKRDLSGSKSPNNVGTHWPISSVPSRLPSNAPAKNRLDLSESSDSDSDAEQQSMVAGNLGAEVLPDQLNVSRDQAICSEVTDSIGATGNNAKQADSAEDDHEVPSLGVQSCSRDFDPWDLESVQRKMFGDSSVPAPSNVCENKADAKSASLCSEAKTVSTIGEAALLPVASPKDVSKKSKHKKVVNEMIESLFNSDSDCEDRMMTPSTAANVDAKIGCEHSEAPASLSTFAPAVTELPSLNPVVETARGIVESPDSGIQDMNSPGKENAAKQFGLKTAVAKNELSAIATVTRCHTVNVNSSPRPSPSNCTRVNEILQQSTEVSPILSPIRELIVYPPLQYKNGKPSLICRLNLALLDRMPLARSASHDRVTTAVVETDADASKSRRSSTASGKVDPGGPNSAKENVELTRPELPNLSDDASELEDVSLLVRKKSSHLDAAKRCKKERLSFSCDSDASDTKLNLLKKCKVEEIASDVPPAVLPQTSTASSHSKSKRRSKKPDTVVGLFQPAEAKSKSVPSPKTGSNTSYVFGPLSHAACSSAAVVQPFAGLNGFVGNLSDGLVKSKGEKPTSGDSTQTSLQPSLVSNTKPITVTERILSVPAAVKIPEFAVPEDYLKEAKQIKRLADGQTDKISKLLLYLESVVYFVLTGLKIEKSVNRESSRPYTMVKDTLELLRDVNRKYHVEGKDAKLWTKLQTLSLRVQALLCLRLFEYRQPQAILNYRQINEYHRTRSHASSNGSANAAGSQSQPSPSSLGGSSTAAGSNKNSTSNNCNSSPTPSPASSTGSGHHSSVSPGSVIIPQHIENTYRQQLSHLHNLMWAFQYWHQARSSASTDDTAFFEQLDASCGCLSFTSPSVDLCSYVLTAVNWLREMRASDSA